MTGSQMNEYLQAALDRIEQQYHAMARVFTPPVAMPVATQGRPGKHRRSQRFELNGYR